MTTYNPHEHTSWTTFDVALMAALAHIKPMRILDIGAGSGKYGDLIRHAGFDFTPEVTALEIDPTCYDTLKEKYDMVDIATASDLLARPTHTYDVVIMGDVLEHFRYSEGLDFLHYMINRAAYIFIITPECMPMNISENFYINHNSIWRPSAFEWFDNWAHTQAGLMHFYILRGYMNGGLPAMQSVCAHINNMGLQAHINAHINENVQPMPIALHHHWKPSKSTNMQGQELVFRPF